MNHTPTTPATYQVTTARTITVYEIRTITLTPTTDRSFEVLQAELADACARDETEPDARRELTGPAPRVVDFHRLS